MMRALVTLFLAALAAFGARQWALATPGEAQPADIDDDGLEDLRTDIQRLVEENDRLRRQLGDRANALVPAAATPSEVSEAEIGAALERWKAAHPMEASAVAEERGSAKARPSAEALILAEVPIQELVRALSNEGLTNFERQELFQQLRESGRIDEYVAAIEKLAAEDPENAELQVSLGLAYLQKLFGVGHSPEAGPLAFKSDAAFDRALELDENNWSARFTKAVSLSNWPAFLGRGPEAIDHFEILVEQQAAMPLRDDFALTYLFLGNMHKASGDTEKALAVWRSGLTLFPQRVDLLQAVEMATPADDRGR